MIPYFIVGLYGFLDLAKVCVMSGGTEIGLQGRCVSTEPMCPPSIWRIHQQPWPHTSLQFYHGSTRVNGTRIPVLEYTGTARWGEVLAHAGGDVWNRSALAPAGGDVCSWRGPDLTLNLSECSSTTCVFHVFSSWWRNGCPNFQITRRARTGTK